MLTKIAKRTKIGKKKLTYNCKYFQNAHYSRRNNSLKKFKNVEVQITTQY